MELIPDNEFSEQFTGDMFTADTMYHNYLAHYTKFKCEYCGEECWIKNIELNKGVVRKCSKCDEFLISQT